MVIKEVSGDISREHLLPSRQLVCPRVATLSGSGTGTGGVTGTLSKLGSGTGTGWATGTLSKLEPLLQLFVSGTDKAQATV